MAIDQDPFFATILTNLGGFIVSGSTAKMLELELPSFNHFVVLIKDNCCTTNNMKANSYTTQIGHRQRLETS